MCKKLVLVKYFGISPDGELCTVSRKYPYEIETKQSIKKGNCICISSLVDGENILNEDRNAVSVVRVIDVADMTKSNEETVDRLIASTGRAERKKTYLGKADIEHYFADLDRRNRIAELSRKIEERFKIAEKEALYRKLAETDPEMKSLLAELDSIKHEC